MMFTSSVLFQFNMFEYYRVLLLTPYVVCLCIASLEGCCAHVVQGFLSLFRKQAKKLSHKPIVNSLTITQQ